MKPQAEFFFSHCKDPIAVSELVTELAAGRPLIVERLPVAILPHVVLLTTIGLRTYEQQIVNDYPLLLERMEECFKAEVPGCWHPHMPLVSLISQAGPRGEYWLDTHPEAGYMFTVYEQLVNNDLEQLFPPPAAAKEARRAAQA